MQFDTTHQVWLAASTDPTRPVFNYVQVNQDVIVATDRFIMAVVPCKLDDGDVPGLVQARDLQQAVKSLPRGWNGGQILFLGEKELTFMNGIKVPRYAAEADAQLVFPDYAVLIPKILVKPTTLCNSFSVNPFLLDCAGKAIGFEGKKVRIGKSGSSRLRLPVLTRFSDNGPMVLRPGVKDADTKYYDGPPTAPFALIMPGSPI